MKISTSFSSSGLICLFINFKYLNSASAINPLLNVNFKRMKEKKLNLIEKLIFFRIF